MRRWRAGSLLLVLFALQAARAQELGTTHLEIIFDASGSMEKETERTYSRELKVRIAREEIRAFLAKLPSRPGLQVAVRVFGTDRDKGCGDTVLLRPFGPIDESLLAAVDGITPAPFGKTPIARSLAQALDDFEALPQASQNQSILLVTDGVETCDGDVDSAISRINASKIALKVHIVGFDVLDWEDPAQKKLEAAAKATGGEALYPKTREELERDLEIVAEKQDLAPAEEAPASPAPSFMQRIMDNIIIVVIGAVIVILAGVFLMMRRGDD